MSGRPTFDTEKKNKTKKNKTPAEAFTPPADEKQIDTNWTFVYYDSGGDGSQAFSYVGQNFLVSKWEGSLD